MYTGLRRRPASASSASRGVRTGATRRPGSSTGNFGEARLQIVTTDSDFVLQLLLPLGPMGHCHCLALVLAIHSKAELDTRSSRVGTRGPRVQESGEAVAAIYPAYVLFTVDHNVQRFGCVYSELR